MGARHWSKAEDAALLALSNQLSYEEIALALGRSVSSVTNRLHKLRRARLRWVVDAYKARRGDGV